MKYFVGILLSLALCKVSNGQMFSVGLESGIGYYKMDGLKTLNTLVIDRLPFNARIVSNYPQYYYYKPLLLFTYNNSTIGVLASFQSTGSRISLKDYSGEYRFDSKIKSVAPAIFWGLNLLRKNKKINFSITTELGFFDSSLTLEENFVFLDSLLVDESTDFTSRNYYFEPGLKLGYNFSFFSVCLNASYCYQPIGSTLSTANYVRLMVKNKEIKPEWDGLRFGLSFFLHSKSLNKK